MNKNAFARFIATWFYSGHLKPASGTWGTFAALPLCLLSVFYLGFWGHIAFTITLFIIGLWATNVYTNATQKHDPSEVVIDEVAGMMIASLPLFYSFDWPMIFMCFILFRIFDAVKIGPVGWLDKNINGAWGVMIDDIAAGLMASICVLIWFVIT